MNALTIRWDETSAGRDRPDPPEQPRRPRSAQAQAARRHRRARPLPAPLAGLHRRHALRALEEPGRLRQLAEASRSSPPGSRRSRETFPTVHQFIVMNECNQPLFVNPQWNSAGVNQSAAICGRALAGAYDALKVVSKSNFVWGVGLSPRGNDSPSAPSNSSTSPVTFLGALGTWFKAFAPKTHRTAPLMDGLDFHPVPGAAVAAVREGLREPARRERLQPAADLPGLLRRLQRLAAADDRPAEGRRAAAQPQRDGDPDGRRRQARATRGSR